MDENVELNDSSAPRRSRRLRLGRVGAVVFPLLLSSHVVGAHQAQLKQLELRDYAQMPITGDFLGENTRGQLARVNYLRDEPGGRRFFVNDNNGPLYILDKGTKAFTKYLDFSGKLFPRFHFERNFASGLISFVFDPDYARNGVFYTIHFEDPTVKADPMPTAGVVPGLDLKGYTTTGALPTPTVDGQIAREAVLVEWTDRTTTNATFEGTAREVMRLQHPFSVHPMGEMAFNPAARQGDRDWRVMYIGIGDMGTGERRDATRLHAQRLDTFSGKILRIVPDPREHAGTSTVSVNGRYRIPNDNPFLGVEGARKEIWAYGLRNPHRLAWHIDLAGASSPPTLLAFNIGLVSWETVMVVQRGGNYGYPLREGTQMMTLEGMAALPGDDTIPVQVSDTVMRGTTKPIYPVIQYPTRDVKSGGDAIAGGFIYQGKRIPGLRGKLVFGDITTGRIWYADMVDVLAADDAQPSTVARMVELDSGLRRLVEEAYKSRGGKGESLPGIPLGILPGAAPAAGRGRVDMRFAIDNDGELYVLTKSDGVIREVVAAR